MLRGTVGPLPVECGPAPAWLFGVQGRVLGYQRGQSLGMPQGQPESDGRTEVHDIQGEPAYPELAEQLAGGLSQMVEGAGIVGPVRDGDDE